MSDFWGTLLRLGGFSPGQGASGFAYASRTGVFCRTRQRARPRPAHGLHPVLSRPAGGRRFAHHHNGTSGESLVERVFCPFFPTHFPQRPRGWTGVASTSCRGRSGEKPEEKQELVSRSEHALAPARCGGLPACPHPPRRYAAPLQGGDLPMLSPGFPVSVKLSGPQPPGRGGPAGPGEGARGRPGGDNRHNTHHPSQEARASLLPSKNVSILSFD